MIGIRPARVEDAAAIGAVHVSAWRSTYADLLPAGYLSGLSALRQAAQYHAAIRGAARRPVGVHVAIAMTGPLQRARVVGFVTATPAPREPSPLADGEIETLYVLDDWRDQGIGRRLLRAAAQHLREQGATSAAVWVLRDNPGRWFYARVGGRHVADSTTEVAGHTIPQSGYRWDTIGTLADMAFTPRRNEAD